jgi:hypothetical protein
MEISMSSNAVQVAHDLLGVTGAVHLAVSTVVAEQGVVMQTKVKARASGRPGPRVQTGDYRRSINRQFRKTATTVTSEVGTNSPQGRRLENGFWGMRDSLGRLFHQPAYPHFGPTGDEMEREFPIAVEAAVDFAIARLAR